MTVDQPRGEGDAQSSLVGEVSHVACRAIQAPVAALLIKAFCREFGRERAVAVATEAVRQDGAAAGRKMAEQFGGNGLAELARVVREVWCRDDGMRISVLEESNRVLRFNATHCGYAEAYAQLGILDLGVCLSCCRDAPFAKAFNPRITLTRTQTIMERGTHCDFCFTLG
ncbi:MAG: L-2-amino-thiazoline-4-carboxylic acid hydrolase [Phycisphaerales bacterium]|nr:MAG: L-2-amino-thiazoline-4-carboxylic acid hydrolase [Phycisphaerales bacterium]